MTRIDIAAWPMEMLYCCKMVKYTFFYKKTISLCRLRVKKNLQQSIITPPIPFLQHRKHAIIITPVWTIKYSWNIFTFFTPFPLSIVEKYNKIASFTHCKGGKRFSCNRYHKYIIYIFFTKQHAQVHNSLRKLIVCHIWLKKNVNYLYD